MRWLGLLLLLHAGFAAEVTLELPDPLIVGAVMTGSVQIANAAAEVQDVSLPQVPGLEWQSAGRFNQMSITNGHRSSVTTIGLSLRASAVGTLQIPAIAVMLADGSTLSSAPRELKVDRPDPRLVGDAFAEAAFEPPAIVPGQPTSLVLRVFLNLKRGGQISLPSFGIAPPEGAITLGEHTIVKGTTVDANGRQWATLTVTWPMTHATPGAYPVRGQQEYQIQVGDGFFDRQVESHQVAVKPATLAVEALPSTGRPAGYTGLIGPLSAKASLDRERVAAGEGTVLSVTVSTRQAKLLQRPLLAVDGVRLYPKDETTADDAHTYRWDVVPAMPGTVTIPPVRFPYFDPASRSYRSADTPALILTVIPGRSRDLGIVGDMHAPRPTSPDAEPPPSLPSPLRGSSPVRPPAWGAPAALLAGLLCGVGAVLARLLPRRSGPHRGRALRAAGGDPVALAAALAALRPAVVTDAQRSAAEALQAAIDRARFGGEGLPDIEAWVRQLEALP